MSYLICKTNSFFALILKLKYLQLNNKSIVDINEVEIFKVDCIIKFALLHKISLNNEKSIKMIDIVISQLEKE